MIINSDNNEKLELALFSECTRKFIWDVLEFNFYDLKGS